MVAIAEPVALSSFSLPGLGTLVAEAARGKALLDKNQSTLRDMEAARAALGRAAESALADARRLRNLGLKPKLDGIIATTEQVVAEIDAVAAEAAAHRARLETPRGWRGLLWRILKPPLATRAEHQIKQSADVIESIHGEIRAFLNQIRALRDAPLPPPEEAPANRAFEAYRRAIKLRAPEAEIGDHDLSISDLGGEIIPVMSIRFASPLSGDERFALEEAAHAEIEAADPSLIGLIAFDYVRQPAEA